ncbi:MAG TPA: methylaspartate mutase, partial [bacterium (Candidatus Stahlbacteria)]|nr:methylaspartate mutase [Candidatus Stahlbacteria bacterium]
ERIRTLRPDMILLSGGIDGGTVSHVVELAELIKAADPRPRFGVGYSLPVIYAGNVDARKHIIDILKENTSLVVVENIRPVLERENLAPARHKIHDQFMEHVMAHAPGYKKLMSWTDVPIMPTPGAVGLLIETIGKKQDIDVLGVDIGGATTDVFSVFSGIFNRTVSANLGMSYSISNVLAEAGVENIMRWIPFKVDDSNLRNRIRNKMIRPTTIPQSLNELKIEQAVAREALRLAFDQHKKMAVGLKGVQQERTISDAFDQTMTGESLVNMLSLKMIVGSGGALSHAPRRSQAAMMLIDSFLPEGITQLAVDSIFMMPHLGVLSKVHETAASEVFDRDCLIRLGTCIAPRGTGKSGSKCIKITIDKKGEEILNREFKFGELFVLPLDVAEKATVS